jgi:hypothetical protein
MKLRINFKLLQRPLAVVSTPQYSTDPCWDAQKERPAAPECRLLQAFQEPPAIYRQQDGMKQPHWNQAEC